MNKKEFERKERGNIACRELEIGGQKMVEKLLSIFEKHDSQYLKELKQDKDCKNGN